MSSSETMEHYVNKLNGMVEECNAIGAKVFFEVKVMMPFMNLPNSYKLLVTSYESYESTRLTWEVVITRLLNEELMRRKNGDSFSAFGIVLVHTNHKSVGSKKTIRNKFQDICNYCNKKGHWVKNCTKRKVDEKSKNFDKKSDIEKVNMEIMRLITMSLLLSQLCPCLVMMLGMWILVHLCIFFIEKIGYVNLKKLHKLMWEIIQHKRL